MPRHRVPGHAFDAPGDHTNGWRGHLCPPGEPPGAGAFPPMASAPVDVCPQTPGDPLALLTGRRGDRADINAE